MNKIQTLQPWSSPKIEKEYLKERYNNSNQNSYGYGHGRYKPGNPVQQSVISLCSTSRGSKTHPYIKSLFCARKTPNMQLAGRLKNFTENQNILTNNTEILSLVEGYTIPFHEIAQQKSISNSPKLSQEEKILVQKEIHEM